MYLYKQVCLLPLHPLSRWVTETSTPFCKLDPSSHSPAIHPSSPLSLLRFRSYSVWLQQVTLFKHSAVKEVWVKSLTQFWCSWKMAKAISLLHPPFLFSHRSEEQRGFFFGSAKWSSAVFTADRWNFQCLLIFCCTSRSDQQYYRILLVNSFLLGRRLWFTSNLVSNYRITHLKKKEACRDMIRRGCMWVDRTWWHFLTIDIGLEWKQQNSCTLI